ncbi:MAG: hypothetical protein AAF206_28310 [Bacteroidota bacterium]
MYFRFSLCFLTLILLSINLSASGIQTFVGLWENDEASYPLIEISQNDHGIRVQAWEKSEEGLQSIGTVEAEIFERVSTRDDATLTATFHMHESQTLFVFSTNGLKVQAKTVTLSNLGRSARHNLITYSKKDLAPAPQTTVVSGMIFGSAVGFAKSTASIFHLTLYGPNDMQKVVQTVAFNQDKSYRFEGLPDGKYWLFVDSRGSTGIQAFPSYEEIEIEDGVPKKLNVEFR